MNHVDRATSGNGHEGRAAGAAEGCRVVIAVNLEAELILSGIGFDGVDLEAARRLVSESTARLVPSLYRFHPGSVRSSARTLPGHTHFS